MNTEFKLDGDHEPKIFLLKIRFDKHSKNEIIASKNILASIRKRIGHCTIPESIEAYEILPLKYGYGYGLRRYIMVIGGMHIVSDDNYRDEMEKTFREIYQGNDTKKLIDFLHKGPYYRLLCANAENSWFIRNLTSQEGVPPTFKFGNHNGKIDVVPDHMWSEEGYLEIADYLNEYITEGLRVEERRFVA